MRQTPIAAHPFDVAELTDTFDYPTPPTAPAIRRLTSLGRGYIAHHILNADGTLTVTHFEIPDSTTSSRVIVERVDEPVTGDFWLVMRSGFFDDKTTYIPFRTGKLVENQSKWVIFP
ncbi:hypothetical protein [Rubripirellula tenax]|uniref:hypothetical protein n=1 Tax=Rubripirellula tenax TaxID=2528015 RepID=UPI0011B76262|nr:hypothetical protein [Rubripirellula tenax]